MGFSKYEKYKDSGVEWLGEIPTHWTLVPLKWLSELVTDKAEGGEWPIGLENVESWSGRFLETESEFSGDGIAFISNDILFGKLRPYLAKAYLAKRSGEAVGDFFVIRSSEISATYLHKYILSSSVIDTLNSSTIGAKMPRVSWEYMAGLPTPVPKEEEQTQIADFLDHETSRIDALIAEQERLIALLKEKRQAVISHAVTKGCDPSVPMKDSGVEWLGEVPEHWAVKKVTYACDIHNNLRTPIDRNIRAQRNGPYPYYGPTGVLDYIDEFYVEGEYFLLGEDGDHFLKFSDKPMTIQVKGKFCVNNHAHLIKGKDDCSTSWAALCFETRDLAPWLIKQGVARYKLRKERVI